jgi:hypothetical protein
MAVAKGVPADALSVVLVTIPASPIPSHDGHNQNASLAPNS